MPMAPVPLARERFMKRLGTVALGLGIIALPCALLEWWYLVKLVLNISPVLYDDNAFWSVGQGIASGLLPYTDLFEIKPPGIFLVTAFSLWSGGGFLLGNVLQAASIIGITVGIVLLTWTLSGNMTPPERRLRLLLSLTWGTLLAASIARAAGHMMPEPFALLFCLGYVASLTLISKQWIRLSCAALCMAGAAGFKEPFLLSCIAAGLILECDMRGVLKRRVIEVFFASVLGVLLLATFGYWDGYVNVYLQYMLTHHVGRHGSLWMRSLELGRLFSDFQRFSVPWKWTQVALLFFGCTVLWKPEITSTLPEKKRRIMVLLLLVGIIAFEFWTNAYRLQALLLGVLNPTAMHRTLLQLLAFAIPALITASILACIGIGWIFSTNGTKLPWRRIGLCVLALWLSLLAVGIGGDFNWNHFLFATPLFIALYVRVLPSDIAVRILLILSSIGCIVHLSALPEYRREYEANLSGTAEHEVIAGVIDDVLDACKIERYAHIGGSLRMITKHSPLGPLYWQRNLYDYVGSPLAEGVMVFLKQADVVVLENVEVQYPLEGARRAYIEEHFTRSPRACAKGKTQEVGPYLILFRKK